MIRVERAPEPGDFDAKIRQPGLAAIAELVGEASQRRRSEPKRKKLADRREDLPAGCFPDFWTLAMEDLLRAYLRLCAYTSFYIEPVSGTPTVDHMMPIYMSWNTVYEWDNYRLASHFANSVKGRQSSILDPFEVRDSWFMLDLVGFQVVWRGPDAVRADFRDSTLNLLNRWECREMRSGYAADYWNMDISLSYLERRAPFVARELRRQGRLDQQSG